MRLFRLILLLMLVAALVPTAMVGWISVSRTRELLVTDAQELAQERVEQLRLRTQNILDGPTGAVVNLARIHRFFQLPLAEQRNHLAAVLDLTPEITVITLFDRQQRRIPGLQAFAVRDVPPSALAAHESVAKQLLSQTAGLVYSTVYGRPDGSPVLTVAFPIGTPVEGYAAAEIHLGELLTMLTRQRIGSQGLAYLIDKKGRLIAGPGLGEFSVGTDVSTRPAVAHFLASARGGNSDSHYVGHMGEGAHRVVGAHTLLAGPRWAVISEQPIETAYRQVATMEREIALGMSAAALAALGLAALFSRQLAQPLRRFKTAAMEVAKGRFGVQVDYKAKNELGELAQTFNYMSSSIEAFGQETSRLYESLEEGYLETILALANSIDSKDSYTRGHSQRVGDMAMEIGKEMGLSSREVKLLRYGGILHDVGKIGIVESILCKQARLTEEEMVVMRDHPVIGDAIIEPVTFLASVRAAVRSHHERWDGKGYPDGLTGAETPLIARIVSCADTFDACTSTRPYSKAMPLERAVEVLDNLKGTQLDPDVVEAIKRVLAKRGVKVEGGPQTVKLAS